MAANDDQIQALELLEACWQLNREVDDCLEVATRDRLPLNDTISDAMAILARHAHSERVWVRTWDESLELRDFFWPAGASELGVDGDVIMAAAQANEPFVHRSSDALVVGQRIDVAGEMFGAAAIRTAAQHAPATVERAQRLLDVWCEEVDNFLAAIARARRKHHVTLKLSAALKNPVLEAGITEAIETLREEVAFDDLVLAYLHENDHDGGSLNYRIVKDGVLVHDSFRAETQADAQTRNDLLTLVRSSDRSLAKRLGISDYREDVLINGVRDEQVVGRLLIASRRGEFNTFDRDLLERFADFIRQRIVDFNREWKVLSQTFPRDMVVRLLSEENYLQTRLQPREQDVAVLFCDLSGFTRLSEQVLKEPALIGKLIDTWSARVVQIIWETGGVFDKMVGDCIIGLWGPPFFDCSARTACAHAAGAAVRIRDCTDRLGDDFPAVAYAGFPVGVATGLNYCPLFVGLFGPNEDYTGFSSGMNNTARLQGVAERGEILAMEPFVEAVGDISRFSEVRTAKVKNVAEAIRFRPLTR